MAHKGTFFDESVEEHPEDSDSDNFDVIAQTAEKLYILRPILCSDIIDPLMKEMRKRCATVLKETLSSFYPPI